MIIRFLTFSFIDFIQDEEDDVLNNNQNEKTRNSSFGKNICFSWCFVLKYVLTNGLVSSRTCHQFCKSQLKQRTPWNRPNFKQKHRNIKNLKADPSAGNYYPVPSAHAREMAVRSAGNHVTVEKGGSYIMVKKSLFSGWLGHVRTLLTTFTFLASSYTCSFIFGVFLCLCFWNPPHLLSSSCLVFLVGDELWYYGKMSRQKCEELMLRVSFLRFNIIVI